jgi:hypothetical protein
MLGIEQSLKLLKLLTRLGVQKDTSYRCFMLDGTLFLRVYNSVGVFLYCSLASSQPVVVSPTCCLRVTFTMCVD